MVRKCNNSILCASRALPCEIPAMDDIIDENATQIAIA
jgi:hypothetical protein